MKRKARKLGLDCYWVKTTVAISTKSKAISGGPIITLTKNSIRFLDLFRICRAMKTINQLDIKAEVVGIIATSSWTDIAFAGLIEVIVVAEVSFLWPNLTNPNILAH